jgi:hypothetical protein
MLSLHNHEAEFRPMGGATPYEMILKHTRPEHLTMELDIGWAVKAGVDPVALFRRHPGRFGLWHVKDIDGQRGVPVPLGQGVIDYLPIFAAADTAGMRHYYVEHDFPADPMASISTSMHYLKRILSAHEFQRVFHRVAAMLATVMLLGAGAHAAPASGRPDRNCRWSRAGASPSATQHTEQSDAKRLAGRRRCRTPGTGSAAMRPRRPMPTTAAARAGTS